MLAIKHVRMTGTEIFLAQEVGFVPADQPKISNDLTVDAHPDQPMVWAIDEHGNRRELWNGTVYVMNNDGRTVDSWVLVPTVNVQGGSRFAQKESIGGSRRNLTEEDFDRAQGRV